MRLLSLTSCLLAAAAQAQLLAPVRSESAPIPGSFAGDTALLTQRWSDGRDLFFGADDTNNGLYAFLVDGGPVPSLMGSFGAVGGIDAVPFLRAFPDDTRGGVVATTGTTAGRVFLFTTLGDAGVLRDLLTIPIATTAPRAVALADFADGGAWLLVESGGTTIQRWRLEASDGGLVPTAIPPVMVGTAVRGIAVAPSLQRAYLSAGLRGVLAFDPREDMPTLVPIVDAGTVTDVMSGLTVYPQADGGALLIAAVPVQNRYRVYQLEAGADFLAEFSVGLEDGGALVRSGEWIDVWPGPFGVLDGGASFPFGVMAVVDRISPSGGRVKLVPWEALAGQVTPALPIDLPGLAAPPVEPMPPALPRVETTVSSPFFDGRSGDVALWPSRALVFGAFAGLSGVGADGGVAISFPRAGPFGGVDARPRAIGPFVDGLVVASVREVDGGQLLFLAPGPDGGLSPVAPSLAVSAARGVALVDSPDGGAFVFVESGTNRVQRVRLGLDDAGLPRGLLEADLVLPAAARAVLGVPDVARLFVSAGSSLWAVDVFGDGGVVSLHDAGAGAPGPAGLAAVSLGDGGLVVIGAFPSDDAYEVFSATTTRARSLGRFEVALADGGQRLRGGAALDVTRAAFGQLADGGAAPGSPFPAGVLAFAETFADGGSVVRLAAWEALTRAVPLSGGTGGGAAGGTGGSSGVGGGGVVEPEPMGCCSGAPVSAGLPGLFFLVWLRRFARRRSSRTLARSDP
ncbi:MAG: phytase [Myxococcaceae bacterium]|nr:phytase [Myxococcaceae bacterium]